LYTFTEREKTEDQANDLWPLCSWLSESSQAKIDDDENHVAADPVEMHMAGLCGKQSHFMGKIQKREAFCIA